MTEREELLDETSTGEWWETYMMEMKTVGPRFEVSEERLHERLGHICSKYID
jgi:hypothetical protein